MLSALNPPWLLVLYDRQVLSSEASDWTASVSVGRGEVAQEILSVSTFG